MKEIDVFDSNIVSCSHFFFLTIVLVALFFSLLASVTMGEWGVFSGVGSEVFSFLSECHKQLMIFSMR